MMVQLPKSAPLSLGKSSSWFANSSPFFVYTSLRITIAFIASNPVQLYHLATPVGYFGHFNHNGINAFNFFSASGWYISACCGLYFFEL